jgi:hypothetical protein
LHGPIPEPWPILARNHRTIKIQNRRCGSRPQEQIFTGVASRSGQGFGDEPSWNHPCRGLLGSSASYPRSTLPQGPSLCPRRAGVFSSWGGAPNQSNPPTQMALLFRRTWRWEAVLLGSFGSELAIGVCLIFKLGLKSWVVFSSRQALELDRALQVFGEQLHCAAA